FLPADVDGYARPPPLLPLAFLEEVDADHCLSPWLRSARPSATMASGACARRKSRSRRGSTATRRHASRSSTGRRDRFSMARCSAATLAEPPERKILEMLASALVAR